MLAMRTRIAILQAEFPSAREDRGEGKVGGMTQQENKPASGTLLDYLRLFRFANVFTAMADVTMGFLFVHG